MSRDTTQVLMADVAEGSKEVAKQVPVAYQEDSFTNKRKQKLFTALYQPASPGNGLGLVSFHHGVDEHVSRAGYKELFATMAGVGLTVSAFDTHGSGKSEPFEAKERSYVASFDYLVDDYIAVTEFAYEQYKLANPDQAKPPLFAVGHSLGGLVAATAVLRKPELFSGLALQSASVDVEWRLTLRVQASIGGLLSTVVPRWRIVPAVLPGDLSQDAEVVTEYLEDPLCNHGGKVRARTANEILKAFQKLQVSGKRLTLPIYAAHGTEDKVTSLPAIKRLLAASPSTDKTINEVVGGYHEILFGPEKAATRSALVAWLLLHATAIKDGTPITTTNATTTEAPAVVAPSSAPTLTPEAVPEAAPEAATGTTSGAETTATREATVTYAAVVADAAGPAVTPKE